MTQVRTVSTRADSTGRSLLVRDEEVKVGKWPGADAGDAIIWSTSKVPVDNSDEDLRVDKRKVGNTIHQGSVFRLTELGPGFRSPMHRTLSTDYCVVLAGALDLCLDGGKIVRLLPGDTLVQRGTNHAWFNPSPSQRQVRGQHDRGFPRGDRWKIAAAYSHLADDCFVSAQHDVSTEGDPGCPQGDTES